MSILVVAAHPDDELLGAGGALIKHVDQGESVHVVIMSEGATARYAEGMGDELHKAAERSAAVMGVQSLTFHDLPDQRLDSRPVAEITQLVEAHIRELKPSTVYAHCGVDVNRDHRVVSEATWTAARPYSAPWVRRIVFFETPSSTEWRPPTSGNEFAPNMFVDISAQLERKLMAMAEYDTELRPYPHPRSLRALEERARYYGSHCGREAAEAMIMVRLVE